MKPATTTLTKILTVAAVVEIATGLVLMIDPAIVIKLLLGIEDSNVVTLLGRFLGVALLSLGVACWPGRPEPTTGLQSFRCMLAYNALIALYLASLGTVGHLGGSLLWPVVVLHAILALSLVWAWRNARRTDLIHK